MHVRKALSGEEEAVDGVLVAAGFDSSWDSGRYLLERTYVLDDDGHLLGVIDGRFDADRFPAGSLLDGVPDPRAWIDFIAVIPHRCHEGIGRRLVHGFAVAASKAGCEYVGLNLRRHDGEEATRILFFEHCGFFNIEAPECPEEMMGASLEKVIRATSV